MSQLHSATTAPGSDSPGPAFYELPVGEEYDPTRGHKFGKQIRMKLGKKDATEQDWVPGPGAYQVDTISFYEIFPIECVESIQCCY